MKIALRRIGEYGAVVLTTMICTFALMSFLVVGYLWMMMEQSKATERSQHWNSALAVAEAGIDEAMAHINYSFGTNVNLGIDGWTSNESCFGPVIRSLSDNVGNSYSVVISNIIPPIVVSTATIIDGMNSIPIKRTVLVTTKPVYAFPFGLTTITNVSLSGNQVTITSSVASVFGNVSAQNGNIYGPVETGPNGIATTNHNGQIGPWTNNFYESFPDVQAPYSFGITPPSPANNLTLQGNTKYYFNGNYNVGGSITVAGTNAVLYVTGNFSAYSISNQPGASLTLYVGSDDLSVSTTSTLGHSSGDKINGSGTPDQFAYFGLPNNTTITLKNGLGQVNGTVYAPEATFTQLGNQTFYGALLAYSYTANGNSLYRVDTNLVNNGWAIGYTVATWKEVPPP